ncbi:hypothetical protein RHODO2019_10815 [Rhodococcus antarcticus]|uniref:Barstar (Barnase inhibitor) n=1 Tax=Rhodococcus antarcticus TaxID=2987751 RepID=A0ABY6NWC9_9NOCA|nr:hypothetical protein [Rhodococcus antarcticus]UZJ23699.1 hypothetical protein RHODO2019_10815 [Rhodococcus antarcticus]
MGTIVVERMTEIDAACQAGCWVDYSTRPSDAVDLHIIGLALDRGWFPDDFSDLEAMADYRWDSDVSPEYLADASRSAVEWMSEHIAPEGWAFVEDGERGGLFLDKLEDDMLPGDKWLDGADLCIHLGVLPVHGAEQREIVERVRDFPLAFTDGDSFVTWGEALEPDEPVHVLVRVTVDPVRGRPTREHVRTLRDVLQATVGGRVIDYYVTTNAQDWSEDAEVTGFYA